MLVEADPIADCKGFPVVAANCPLASLVDAVVAVERALGIQEGPLLLVGHSWGDKLSIGGRYRVTHPSPRSTE